MKRLLLFLIAFLILIPRGFLRADEHFFSYLGTTFAAGVDKIKYKDWIEEIERRDTKNISGSFYSGGIVLDIFIKKIIGEFKIEYVNNSNSEEAISVRHMIYTAIMKYSYQLIRPLYLTTGLGLYLETPPSNRSYNSGGGVNMCFGTMYDINKKMKVILDLSWRYGYFGIGERSTRYSYGVSLGLVYRVGRI